MTISAQCPSTWLSMVSMVPMFSLSTVAQASKSLSKEFAQNLCQHFASAQAKVYKHISLLVMLLRTSGQSVWSRWVSENHGLHSLCPLRQVSRWSSKAVHACDLCLGMSKGSQANAFDDDAFVEQWTCWPMDGRNPGPVFWMLSPIRFGSSLTSHKSSRKEVSVKGSQGYERDL